MSRRRRSDIKYQKEGGRGQGGIILAFERSFFLSQKPPPPPFTALIYIFDVFLSKSASVIIFFVFGEKAGFLGKAIFSPTLWEVYCYFRRCFWNIFVLQIKMLYHIYYIFFLLEYICALGYDIVSYILDYNFNFFLCQSFILKSLKVLDGTGREMFKVFSHPN